MEKLSQGKVKKWIFINKCFFFLFILFLQLNVKNHSMRHYSTDLERYTLTFTRLYVIYWLNHYSYEYLINIYTTY